MSRPKKQRRVARPQARSRRRLEKQSPAPQRVAIATVAVVTVVVGVFMLLALGEEPAANVVERDPAIVAAGEELYAATCAVCHGTDLRGSATGPPFLVPTYAPNHHADEAFQRAVAFGVQPHHWGFGPMAPLPGLSRDDVSKIVAYVRTIQESQGIFRDPTHP